MTVQSQCEIELVQSQPKTLQTLQQDLRKFLPYLHRMEEVKDLADIAKSLEISGLTFDYSYVSNRGTLRYRIWGFRVEIRFVVKVNGPTIYNIEIVYPDSKNGSTEIIGHNYYEIRKIGRREFTFKWDENGDLTMINVGRESNSLTYLLMNGSWCSDGPHYKTAPKNLARCKKFMGVVIPWKIDYSNKVEILIGHTELYHLFVCFREIWPCELCFSNFAAHPEGLNSDHAYKAKFLAF